MLVRSLEGHINSIFSLRCLPNGQLASCSFDDTIKVWNPYIREQNLLWSMPGHGIKFLSVQMGLLPSGHLVTCSNENDTNNTIRIWDPKQRTLAKQIPVNASNASSLLVFSSGNRLVVGFDSGAVHVINSADGSVVKKFSAGQDGEVSTLHETPNGYLLTAGFGPASSIKIWDLEAGQLVQAVAESRGVLSVAASHELLASGSCKSLNLWSLIYD